MDILDDMGVSHLSAKVCFKSELLLQCYYYFNYRNCFLFFMVVLSTFL